MSAKKNIAASFGAETRFAVTPEPAVPFRAGVELDLDRLKNQLLREWIIGTEDAELNFRLRRAAHEACLLARSTPFPLLVFPVLYEEKAAAACGGMIYRVRSCAGTHELACAV
jgi:hypothetical protein